MSQSVDWAKDIQFQALTEAKVPIVYHWLNEPHVKEFWDNSQAHKDDIINFVHGRKVISNYFNGIFSYWIGSLKGVPYCLVMTAPVYQEEDAPQLWRDHISPMGHTYSIDFCIGDIKHLGKGLAAPTLRTFCEFLRQANDPKADTFFIDPDENNPRAYHVYDQAGFKPVGDFTMEHGYFEGHKSVLMVKKMPISNETIDISFRDLKEEDLKDLNHWFGENTRFKNPESKWRKYLNCIQSQERMVRVIEHKNQVIGLGTLVFESLYKPFREQNIYEINDLLIAEPYQGYGLGTYFLDHYEAIVKAKGLKKMGLAVGLYKDYGPAQRLYVKNGYVPDGRGVTYNNLEGVPGVNYRLDDDFVLWMIKEI